MKNYKKIIFILIVFFLGTTIKINAQQALSIDFNPSTFAELKAKAKKDKKIIFIDAYASWCGPCKWMSGNVFNNSVVADFYNSNFINAKIDMEKGEGKDIAKQYEVTAYPNLLFIDGDGKLVHRFCGAMVATDFVALGKEALVPEKQFGTFKKKYDAGDRTPAFVKSYLDKLTIACLSTDKIVADYLKTQQENDLTKKENWQIINLYLSDMDSREFNYLVKNKSKFSALYSSDTIDAKIYRTYLNKAANIIHVPNFKDQSYIDIKAKIKASEFTKKDELLLHTDLHFYEKKKDWTNYSKTAIEFFDKYKTVDYDLLNHVAWLFYKNISDNAQLEKGVAMAKRATEIKDASFTNDTYAMVLFKLGKKDDAIKAEEKAIKLAKKAGEPTDEYERNLESIKNPIKK